MESRINANGIEMSYQLDGPADAPVLMLSNSLLTDYGMWDLQVPAFSAKYRLLRYDTRGHGGTSATPGPYTIDLLATDALALLDALRIDRVHFLGLSMGGMIAQCLAAKHGSRLKSVVLCDTACHLPPESAWDDRIALAQSKGTSAFIKPMTERWLTQPYRESHPAQLEKMGAMIARTAVDGLVGCAHAIKKMNQASILSAIKMPTLIVVGEQDVGTPVSAAEFLHREIAGSKLEVIKNAGHLPNIEQTDLFNRTVLDFLAR
ncbi:MAG: 3-oxoadipate enol-lactonase [Burkholderiales bacterium]